MRIVIVLLSVALSGCLPAKIYVQATKDVGSASQSFNEAMQSGVEDMRNEQRILQLRKAASAHLIGISDFESGVVDTVFLCDPRYVHARMVQRLAHIRGVSTFTAEMTKPSQAELGDLLRNLAKDYNASGVARVDDNALDRQILRPCYDEMEKYVFGVYPLPTDSVLETGVVEALTAAYSFYKAAREMLEPLATEALREVDEQRRGEALARFFRGKQNVEELKAAVRDLNRNYYLHIRVARQLKVRDYVTAMAEFQKVAALPSATPACAAMSAAPPGPPNELDKTGEVRRSPAFALCFKELWGRIEPAAKKMLQAAADYDVVADRGYEALDDKGQTYHPAARKLNEAIDKLHDLANGKAEPSELYDAFLATAVEWKTIAENIKTAATSEQNRKKIDEAWTRLREAI